MGILPSRQLVVHDFKAGQLHVPAAATAAVITLAAVANRQHAIHDIHYSYDATPTGGNILITDDGTTVFDLDIPAAGEKHLPIGLRGDFGAAVVITLASGGGAVQGKLHVTSSIDE